MRFVNKHARTVRVGDIGQLVQIAEITVHRINSLHDYQLATSRVTPEGRIERGGVIVLEFFRSTARKDCAVTTAPMRGIIQNGNVVLAKQAGDRAESAANSAVEEHRVFPAKKFCDLTLELAMEIGHAGEHRRAE